MVTEDGQRISPGQPPQKHQQNHRALSPPKSPTTKNIDGSKFDILDHGPIGPLLNKAFVKGKLPYDDVKLALDLTGRLARLTGQRGNLLRSVEHAHALADLTELTHGWDTAEAGEARREVR